MRAYVGLGANLGDREATLERALELLGRDVRILAVSSFRETAPWGLEEQGLEEQPSFINAAAAVETDLAPRDLLELLLEVERSLGRVRGKRRYGPRTIDLDLLLYGDLELEEPELTVPHPRLHERRFALEPLAELDPGVVVPGRGTVSDLLAALDAGS